MNLHIAYSCISGNFDGIEEKYQKEKARNTFHYQYKYLTQSLNAARSWTKDNQKVPKLQNLVKLNGANPKRTKICDADHESKGLVMPGSLLNHLNVKTCHKKKNAITSWLLP